MSDACLLTTGQSSVPFPDSFETARLLAERLQPAHEAAIRAMHQDPVHMAMLGGVRSDEQTAAYMVRNLKHWDDYGFGFWILRDRATNAVIGRAILRHLDVNSVDEVEVGYSLVPAFWGRGLATEIATKCLRLGGEDLGLASIVAVTLPENTASRRVMEKIGMTYERDFTHDAIAHVLYRTNQSDT
jgi:ribosomal-protein-alanine N-acetyltransferase